MCCHLRSLHASFRYIRAGTGLLFEVYQYRRQIFAAWLMVPAAVITRSHFNEAHVVLLTWLIGRVWLLADAAARLIPMIMFAITTSRFLVYMAPG